MIMKTVRRELLDALQSKAAVRAWLESLFPVPSYVAMSCSLMQGPRLPTEAGQRNARPLPPRSAHRCLRHARGAVKTER